jgi:hypothetical protein
MDDVRAVMDAAGSERAAVFGISEGGPLSVLFAATYPSRVFALVLYAASPRNVWAPDWPHGVSSDEWRGLIDGFGQGWGTPEFAARLIEGVTPSFVGDAERLDYFASFLRMSASPGAAAALMRMNMGNDVRHILPAIRVPTLVLHREQDRALGQSTASSRYMAETIPAARFVLLSGVDHFPWLGDSDAVLRETQEFLEQACHLTAIDDAEPERVLATVLFTDIVESSERAAALGDRTWRELLGRHHELIRRQLVRFRGREVDTAGDGFLASFDGPARAIRCARAIVDGIGELGIEIRAGPGRTAHRRVRALRREGGRHRRPHRCACGVRSGRRRGARVEHGEGPRRRLRPHVRGPRHARAQRSRLMAAVRRRAG